MTTETGQQPENTAAPIVKIPFEGVTPSQLVELGQVLEIMSILAKDLQDKAVAVNGWYVELTGMIAKLIEDKHMPADTKLDGQEELAHSVKVYLELLAKVATELAGEIQFFACFLTDKPPAEIEVSGQADLSAPELITKKTAAMRKSAKAIKRSSQVSFSRYEHALEGKIRRLKAGMIQVVRPAKS